MPINTPANLVILYALYKPETLVELVRIDRTRGYGHFHLSEDLFTRLRNLLAAEGHTYASGHQFGQSPNWRFRVIRVGLERLGLEGGMTMHGIECEIYAMPMEPDFKKFLCREISVPALIRPSSEAVGQAAVRRWIIPRALKNPDFCEFQRSFLYDLMEAE